MAFLETTQDKGQSRVELFDFLMTTSTTSLTPQAPVANASLDAAAAGTEPTSSPSETTAGQAPGKKAKPTIAVQPVLEKLFELYPHLFGARFLPLKLGIFQDLLAAHPDQFDKAALKMALGRHTRSTAYLQAVAKGKQRYDLSGAPAGDLAPEHIYMALVEWHKRRQSRTQEDLSPKLRKQMVLAFQQSGLSRQEYLLLVQSPDEATNTLLAQALGEVDEKAAKQAALLRAYEASGKSVDEFAEMYGLDRRDVLVAFKAGLKS